MKIISVFGAVAIFAAGCGAAVASDQAAAAGFLVSNNDATSFGNAITFFTVGSDGSLARKLALVTGGLGIGGGSFAENRIIVVPSAQGPCVFASDAGSGDVAGINANTQTVTGQFFGSSNDSGIGNGIGLAVGSKYLYANYSTSYTIGTFQIQSGCKLAFIGDVTAIGLQSGWATGMAIHGSLMIVTYGDGSIESFNVSGGLPVSNGDVQNSTGFGQDHIPNGIDITRDGHYAIFGDASTVSTVEVSDISSGKLAPTVAYDLGTGWNSGNVRLSPDESTLFVSNDSSGQVTAAFFDKTTGKISPGCTSNTLKNFYSQWSYAGNIGLQLSSGTGGLLYIPEFGSSGTSSIGLVQFTSTGSTCTLTETASSPLIDSTDSSALLSIGVYPPRPF